MRKYTSGKCDLLAKIVLDNYPPYLTKDKIYRMKGRSQIDANTYFVITDDGSTTSVDISQLKLLHEIRNEKIDKILGDQI